MKFSELPDDLVMDVLGVCDPMEIVSLRFVSDAKTARPSFRAADDCLVLRPVTESTV